MACQAASENVSSSGLRSFVVNLMPDFLPQVNKLFLCFLITPHRFLPDSDCEWQRGCWPAGSMRRPSTTHVAGFSWPLNLMRPKQNLANALMLPTLDSHDHFLQTPRKMHHASLCKTLRPKEPVLNPLPYLIDCEQFLRCSKVFNMFQHVSTCSNTNDSNKDTTLSGAATPARIMPIADNLPGGTCRMGSTSADNRV